MIPSFQDDERCKFLASMLPPAVAYRVRIHKVQVEATHLVASSLNPEKRSAEPLLSTTINSFHSRLKDNYRKTGDDLGKFESFGKLHCTM